jgi:hypothetical protein
LSGITDADWQLIEELRQGVNLISSGQASPEFAATFEQRLATLVPNEQVRQVIRGLAT